MNRKAIFLLIIIYLAFISLGLPDPMLGSAWPTMYMEMGVPVSYAGILSMIISVGTVVSSLLSDRITRRMGTSLMPPLFGMITERIGVAWLPVYLFLILVMMVLMHERLLKKTGRWRDVFGISVF